jgi:flagellar assembly factor FliW
MPICETKFHGPISFEPEQVLQVPAGLFGFPEETEFLLLELPSSRPIVFMQSVRSSALCFISLPVQVIDPDYQLSIRDEDLKQFGYRADSAQAAPRESVVRESVNGPPVMGKDLLCLALLSTGEKRTTTANLLAPIVIDIANHHGMQVIVNLPYSHQHALPAPRFTPSVDQ